MWGDILQFNTHSSGPLWNCCWLSNRSFQEYICQPHSFHDREGNRFSWYTQDLREEFNQLNTAATTSQCVCVRRQWVPWEQRMFYWPSPRHLISPCKWNDFISCIIVSEVFDVGSANGALEVMDHENIGFGWIFYMCHCFSWRHIVSIFFLKKYNTIRCSRWSFKIHLKSN